MSGRIDQRLAELGITLPDAPVPSANYVPFRRSGNQVFIAGQISVTGDESATGKVGGDLSVEDGYAAARDCAAKILNSVHNAHGTINGLKVIKLLGCVYSAPDFTDQHLVINGASDLLHEIYGKEGDGYHARSALGFAALPTGAAVEVEAIFEIIR